MTRLRSTKKMLTKGNRTDMQLFGPRFLSIHHTIRVQPYYASSINHVKYILGPTLMKIVHSSIIYANQHRGMHNNLHRKYHKKILSTDYSRHSTS